MSSLSGTRWNEQCERWISEANCIESDGIARVHGMSNVQAEELVEYARPAKRFAFG